MQSNFGKIGFFWKNLEKNRETLKFRKAQVSMKEPHENTGGFHNLLRLGFCERTSNERFSRSGFSERTLAVRWFSNLSNVGFLSKNLMHFWVLGQKGARIFKKKFLPSWRWGRVWIFWKLPGQRWGWGFHKMRTANHDI